LILEDSNSGDELTSEEITINSDCGELRKVAIYDGGKITAVELINLWNQDLNYFVFQYDGQPQPKLPTSPAPIDERDGIDIKTTVVDNETGEAIENANVVIGDISQKTNSDGETIFTNIDPGVELSNQGNEIGAVAYKPGYLPSPVRTVPVDGTWTNPQEEEFRLDVFEPESPSQKNGNISPSNSVRVPVSSGSGGGGTVVGGGGFTGSSGGGNGYSWSGGSSSGSSGGFYSSSGQTPITFSSSTPISQPSTSTFTIPQPERLFNIIEIDDSLIPQGEDFLIRTTVGSTINKSLTDSVEIYKIESSEEISDITSDNLIGSEDITIPKNNTITNEQNLSINTIGEYTIYVSLKESDKYKVAGTLDVFDANRENASIEDGSITPKNAGTDENVTVEINRTNINFEGADGVKVDIFENGIRVAEGEVMNKADSNLVGNEKNKLTYIKSYPQPQYVQYHAGIQESQDVKLLDTRIISNEIQNDDISEFIANAEIINRDTICKTDTYTSDQFDCEVTIGNHNPLDFSAENSSFTDSNGNPLDMNYTWIMGSERTISINDKSEIVSQTFEDDTVHLVEFRASTTINKKTYEKRVPFMINAVSEDNTNETTNTEDNNAIGDFSIELQMNTSYEVGENIKPVVYVSNLTKSEISKYTWEFDSDGEYNTNTNTTAKYYSNSGSHTITATVTAKDGSTKNTSIQFDVTIQTPSINATGGESYKFTDENDITYRIHVFNTIGEHTIEFNKYDSQSSMDVLVVGGGGGGASHRGGGGGAGGLIFNENININQNQYSLTVGDGGMGADSGQTEYGSDGDNSVFDSWNATGGGGGAPYGDKGRDGGSGGGSGTESQIGDGGSGISGQGNDGGGANDNSGRSGLAGGGGGAGSVGEDGLSSNGRIDNYGDGGIGLDFTDLFGTSVGDSGWFAG